MTTRRTAMRAYGEYLDFAAWLARAKLGVDVDPDDPPVHEIARMTKGAGERAEEKKSEYIRTIESLEPNGIQQNRPRCD